MRVNVASLCVIMTLIATCHLPTCTTEAAPVTIIQGPPQPSQRIESSLVISLFPKQSKRVAVDSGIVALPTISYGKYAAPGDFPYACLLALSFGTGAPGSAMYSARCACTVIAPRVVMTAGE